MCYRKTMSKDSKQVGGNRKKEQREKQNRKDAVESTQVFFPEQKKQTSNCQGKKHIIVTKRFTVDLKPKSGVILKNQRKLDFDVMKILVPCQWLKGHDLRTLERSQRWGHRTCTLAPVPSHVTQIQCPLCCLQLRTSHRQSTEDVDTFANYIQVHSQSITTL